MCHAQELGSYAQGQGHNQVSGQLVPKIMFLIKYWNKFDETSQKDKASWEDDKSEVKIMSQQ